MSVQRAYTRRLSQLLASPDGSLVLAMMQKLAGASSSGHGNSRMPRADGTSVGVWRHAEDAWVRDPERRGEWHYWADKESLKLAPDKRRVALVGESVARGYFYDPRVTFAQLTEQAVSGLHGLSDVDVLDLAKTDATAGDIVTVLLEAAQLRPSAFVIFAGNNWNYVRLAPARLQELADAVRDGGFLQARLLFQDYIVRQAASVLDAVAAVCRRLSVPAVLVIPEFNLADWKEERTGVCPLLPDSTSAHWLRLGERILEELEAGNLTAAERLARAMTKMDGGSSPVSEQVLARVLESSDPEEAERALIAAKDAPIGTFTSYSPRIFSGVQKVMRAKSFEHGFHMVDLAAEMRHFNSGNVPDRKFFLDYCHLNFDGLVLAAAQTGAVLRDLLGGTKATVEDISKELAAAPPGNLGIAHFLAALHNSHYGQVIGLVKYHLETALSTDNTVANLMHDYLDYQTRQAPHWMCRSYLSSSAVPEMRYLRIWDARSMSKLADYELRSLMAQLLNERDGTASAKYRELLVTERACREIDLLDDACHATTFHERTGHGPGAARAFFVARDLRSEFHLVAQGPESMRLSVAWRLPAGDPDEATVLVRVNGEHLGSVSLSTGWLNTELVIPDGRLRRGDNVIQITWPLRTIPGNELLAAASESLERGVLPDSLAIHGHIFMFSAARRTATEEGAAPALIPGDS